MRPTPAPDGRRGRLSATPESRRPAFAAAIVVIAGQTWVSYGLGVRPVWLYTVVSAVLLLASIGIYESAWKQPPGVMRWLSAGLIGVLVVAEALGVALLVRGVFVGSRLDAIGLVTAGCALWAVNVAMFALAYWELDAGGPEARIRHKHIPDLVFPQQQENGPGLVPHAWQPRFSDYLYVSLTAATAFSPTDAMPYTWKAKLVMGVESTMSFAIFAMVVARAVNVAHG
jgi:uncharacterized membrane protein